MKHIIRCPYCEYEYVPSEIYLPNSLLGKPRNIYKDLDGKIDSVDSTPNLNETYCCDNCNKHFKVSASIKFNVTKFEELNFDEDFSTPLYKDRIVLKEE